MGKIFGSAVLGGIGLIMVSVNTPLPQFPKDGQILYIGLGGLLQVGAAFLFIAGCKEYFFSEIITELKKLSAKD